jgi:tight adherence protein C
MMLAAMEIGLGVWQVLLTVAIFGSVTFLVMTLFSQPGEIHMSPQREAAILAGEEDRKTVFEKPVTRPIMRLLLILAGSLSLDSYKDWTRRRLIAAGSPNYYTTEEHIALTMLTALVVGTFGALLGMFPTQGKLSLFAILLGGVVGAGLNLLDLHNKASDRLRAIARQVPYSLDLISLAMGAGATFVEAVETVVGENKEDDPFNAELRALLAEMELGTTRRRALENMADRVPLDNLRAIISSVVQAEELGTPLADVLHLQATLLRQQRSVRAENLAAEASVKILIPCLLIMFAVLLAVLGPWLLTASKSGWLN